MGHSYNYGVVTSAKGFTTEAIRLVASDGSGTMAIAEDCGAGLVSGVTRVGAGEWLVQMAKPYPPKAIIITPQLSCAAKTTAIQNCRYKTGSYDATAGTFTYFVSDAAGTTGQDPPNGAEVHIDIAQRRYTANP